MDTSSPQQATVYDRLGNLDRIISQIEGKLFPQVPQECTETESASPSLNVVLGKLEEAITRLEIIGSELGKL